MVQDSCHSEDAITGAWGVKRTINTQLLIIVNFIQMSSHSWCLDKAIPSKGCLLYKSYQIKTSLLLGILHAFSILLLPRLVPLIFNLTCSPCLCAHSTAETTIRMIHGPCSSVRVSTNVLIKHFVSERENTIINALWAHIY